MAEMENSITDALARLSELEPECERHMVVFPIPGHPQQALASLQKMRRVVHLGPVAMVCRNAG